MRVNATTWTLGILVATTLACGGLGASYGLKTSLVELHLQPQTPARDDLIRFVEHAALDCESENFPPAPCENLTADLRTVDAKDITPAWVAALQQQHPNFASLDEAAPSSPALAKLRKGINRRVDKKRDDFDRWDEGEIELRMKVLGWQPTECDAVTSEEDVDFSCYGATPQGQHLEVHVYRYDNVFDQKNDQDETVFPGSIKEQILSKSLLNIRAFDEVKTRALATRMGLDEPTLPLAQTKQRANEILERVGLPDESCTSSLDAVECFIVDGNKAIQLELAHTDTPPGTTYRLGTWTRTTTDGISVSVTLNDDDQSRPLLQSLLDAR